MPKFISEHENSVSQTREEWTEIAIAANKAVRDAGGKVSGLNAWITKESISCLDVADSEKDVRDFVEKYNLPPLISVSEVSLEFDPGMVGSAF